MRMIRVTGQGQFKTRPDLTRVTATLERVEREYGEALRRSAEDTEALRTLLEGLGFAREALKTLSFGVDPEHEGYQEEGAWRQRLVGYRYRHVLKLEFPLDNARLGTVLGALAGCPQHPELQLSYTVSDPGAAKNRLLARAVADAKAKAEALAEAAGMALGELQSIDYSWGKLDLEVRPMNRMVCAEECAPMAKAGLDLDIEPDDIELTDTVTMVWAIGEQTSGALGLEHCAKQPFELCALHPNRRAFQRRHRRSELVRPRSNIQ